MKIEFVTHGLKTTKQTVGHLLNESFQDNDFNEFRGISAFTRKSGINKFKKSLLENKERFKKVTFTLGIVPRGTSIEALDFFLENNIECYAYLNDHSMLHSKIYYFTGKRFSRFIIGSSNLTSAGLSNNIESSVVIEFKSGDRNGNKFIKEYYRHFGLITSSNTDDFIMLTQELLEQLKEDSIVFSEYGIKSIDEYENDTSKRIRRSKRKYIRKQKSTKSQIKDKFIPKQNATTINLLSQSYFNNWAKYLDLYKQYIRENKTTVVSKKTRISGLKGWYNKQKKLYKEGIIPEEHLRILKNLNFPFLPAHYIKHDLAWNARVKEYKDYVKKYKTHHLPRTRDKNNPLKGISDWAANTRSDHRKDKLPKHRVEELDVLGFLWEVGNAGGQKKDDKWMQQYFELVEYKRVHGHSNVPQYNIDGSLNFLGRYVNEQRILYRGRKKHGSNDRIYIDPDRKELLDEIGFEWKYDENKKRRNFMKKLEKWQEAVKLYPKLNFPKGEFRKEKQWRAQMKYHFKSFAEWKQEILIQEQVITLPNK